MLYHLMDNRARTSTELAAAAEVTPSTASVHLNRLKAAGLVKVRAQGKHRYYTLAGSGVAEVLEALSVLAGGCRQKFEPNTPRRLRTARTCYDHLAGTLGVALHDNLRSSGCLSGSAEGSYELTRKGRELFESLGVDIESMRALRRRFAFACLDWSERRSHLGGAAGAALLGVALKRRWVMQDLDSRALSVTRQGQRELLARFGIDVQTCASFS
jgi:DNA-binding PadR family transcriptional regulator